MSSYAGWSHVFYNQQPAIHKPVLRIHSALCLHFEHHSGHDRHSLLPLHFLLFCCSSLLTFVSLKTILSEPRKFSSPTIHSPLPWLVPLFPIDDLPFLLFTSSFDGTFLASLTKNFSLTSSSILPHNSLHNSFVPSWRLQCIISSASSLFLPVGCLLQQLCGPTCYLLLFFFSSLPLPRQCFRYHECWCASHLLCLWLSAHTPSNRNLLHIDTHFFQLPRQFILPEPVHRVPSVPALHLRAVPALVTGRHGSSAKPPLELLFYTTRFLYLRKLPVPVPPLAPSAPPVTLQLPPPVRLFLILPCFQVAFYHRCHLARRSASSTHAIPESPSPPTRM